MNQEKENLPARLIRRPSFLQCSYRLELGISGLLRRKLGTDIFKPWRFHANRLNGDQNFVTHFLTKDVALATDLYELTMAAAYFDNNETGEATFELFVRNFPRDRSYLIAAGLKQAVEYLSKLRFKKEHVSFLRKNPTFRNVSKEFFEYLEKFRFTGDVWAIPEGTIFFTDEPVLRVTAPMIEAQIVETYLLSLINFETLIATKASRVVQSARGKGVVEFGSRRAHGPEAALLAARASYIGGCIGTSNVLAGYLFGIPIYGTMAHSFVMNYDSEEEAFERFCRVFPSNRSLLLDTYDTVEGARKAVSSGLAPSLVRLDSGDRYDLSVRVRKILDDAGLKDARIFVSGDLNEFVLDDLTSRGAPIDSFGVGTELVTSRDDPALSGIYKLVSVRRNGKRIYRAKTSEGKRTIPGAKQVYRRYSPKGEIHDDTLALDSEDAPPNTVPLLIKVFNKGKLVYDMPNINAIRERTRREVATLPAKYKSLTASEKSPVRLSAKLEQLTNSLWSTHNSTNR
jgi:nicotinate phosphoribosyltransferase